MSLCQPVGGPWCILREGNMLCNIFINSFDGETHISNLQILNYVNMIKTAQETRYFTTVLLIGNNDDMSVEEK